MEQQWNVRATFHVIHTIFRQPMETFQEQKQSEQCHKSGRQVITKDSKGQTSFRHRVPTSLNQMLHFCSTQLTKKHFAYQLSKQEHKNNGLQIDDLGEKETITLPNKHRTKLTAMDPFDFVKKTTDG